MQTQTVDRKLGSSIYCTFHKHANSEVQSRNDDCVFRCCQSSYLNGPLRKQSFTSRVQMVMICGFRSVLCSSVSRFVACDRNYDWRQRKTQLWRLLLKFRVLMFVKSAAKSQWSRRPLDQAGSMGSWLSVLVYFWFSYNTIFLSSVNQLRPSHFMLVERQQFLEFPVMSN